MPDKEFSKVSPDRSERKIGEAPHLGKVSRSPQSAVKNMSGRGRHGGGGHDSRKKRRNTVITAWSGLLAVVTLAVVVAFVVLKFKGEAERRETSATTGKISTDLDKAFSSSAESEVPSLGQEEALKIVATALENRDPLLFPEYFVPPAVGTTAEAIAELSEAAAKEGPVSEMRWIGPKLANHRIVEQVVVSTEKDGEKHNRLAQLVPTSDGGWRIDFDSYMRTASAGWEHIVAGRVPAATVRIFLAADSYYNGIFSDERTWQSYTLVSPDTPEILYGYSRKGSPQHSALTRILSNEDKAHRATLVIRTLPEAGERQFEISRVLAENWVLGEKDFDRSF